VLRVFDCSLEFVFFSAVTSAFQLFTRKLCLHFSGLRMRNFTWNRFPIKNLLIDSLLTPIVESTYLNGDMCKFEALQKDESRAQSTDSSKAYRTLVLLSVAKSISVTGNTILLTKNKYDTCEYTHKPVVCGWSWHDFLNFLANIKQFCQVQKVRFRSEYDSSELSHATHLK